MTGPPIRGNTAAWNPKVTLAYAADCGTLGTPQDEAFELMRSWHPDGWLLAGDLSYGTGVDVDLAEIAPETTAHKVWPARGNHDIESPGKITKFTTLFSYVQNGGRYYKKTFGGGLVDLFVLNDGVNTAGTLVEPDGNTVGSDQYNWFTAAVAASQARWKFVMFHRPPVSGVAGALQVATAMDWGFQRMGIHAIFCGHGHGNGITLLNGVPLFNISTCTQTVEAWGVLQGATESAYTQWFENTKRGVMRIEADADGCRYDIVCPQDSTVLHSGVIHNADLGTGTGPGRAAWGGVGYIYAANEDVGPELRHFGFMPDTMAIAGIRVSCIQPQAGQLKFMLHKETTLGRQPLFGQALILKGTPAPGDITAGRTEFYPVGAFLEAGQRIAAGSRLTFEITEAPGGSGATWKGLEVALVGTFQGDPA